MIAVNNPIPAKHIKRNLDREARLRKLAEDLLKTEIQFISNPEFAAEDDVSDDIVEQTLEFEKSGGLDDLPPHLRGMCETELLSREQEAALFREMNLRKYQANALRSGLNPDKPDRSRIAQIKELLNRSDQIRDHIIRANVRLVMSIVKKFVSPQQSFDDMLSDGIFTLMQAVEKFDFDRGFRFSTYAYRAIARNTYRQVMKAKQEEARFTRDAEQWAFENKNDESSSMTDQKWFSLRELTGSMLKQLDRRERFIIRSRFALGGHRKVRTFQFLAEKLGISKERVRQLEMKALDKLREMAGQCDAEELLGVGQN